MNMFDVNVDVGQGPASAKPGTPLASRDDEPLGYVSSITNDSKKKKAKGDRTDFKHFLQIVKLLLYRC